MRENAGDKQKVEQIGTTSRPTNRSASKTQRHMTIFMLWGMMTLHCVNVALQLTGEDSRYLNKVSP